MTRWTTYHGDADSIVKLPHTHADERRGQQQQDQWVLELENEKSNKMTRYSA